MSEFKIYLRNEKIKWLYKIKEEMARDFGIELPHGAGFTRSDFCHFIIIEDKKYVHKGAMAFILTNGGTYFEHQQIPKMVKINDNLVQRNVIDLKVEKMFHFFRHEINTHKLYPQFLSETEHFFVFKYYSEDEWMPLTKLTSNDSAEIRRLFDEGNEDKKEVVTPFYNQVINKLFKNKKSGAIVMIDLKILEFHPKGPLAILMHNKRINDLYLLERRYWTRSFILKPYALDYYVHDTKLIKHY